MSTVWPMKNMQMLKIDVFKKVNLEIQGITCYLYVIKSLIKSILKSSDQISINCFYNFTERENFITFWKRNILLKLIHNDTSK